MLETLVESNLFNLKNSKKFFEFSIFYDSYKVKKKKRLILIVKKKDFDYVISIEIGHGNKSIKQIKDAIKRYNVPHGIVISDTTKKTIESRQM